MQDPFLSVHRAQSQILEQVQACTAFQMLPIREALDLVLAKDILSPIHVPAHDNSAMDGYALNGADIQSSTMTTLKIVGTVLAGQPFQDSIKRGQCVRIMTGAVMPEGCDTVVIQENITVKEDSIQFAPGAVTQGDNRRLKGEDLTRGKPALNAGKILTPADLGLLASLGIAEVPVRTKIKVAFFSTGSELRSLGQTLDPGCVYDSNRYTIHGMLKKLNFVELIDLGVVEDNPAALEATMTMAASIADAIITSGGVSVGEADHTKEIMTRLGSVDFWKIAMRPGRPMAFGTIERGDGLSRATLFGLPGNPVAVMITFYAFVRDALAKMAGARLPNVSPVIAKVRSPVRKKAGRTEYQRVRLVSDNGELFAELTGAQGSGVLRSMSEADGLLILEHEQGSLAAGEKAKVLPFYGLI